MLFAFVLSASSQLVRLGSGMSISSIDKNEYGLFRDNLYSNSYSAGIEYWRHRYFYLSSEAAYVAKGGKWNMPAVLAPLFPPSARTVTAKGEYIHVNTTLRGRCRAGNVEFYLGIGPKVDFVVGSDISTGDDYGMEYDKLSFGLVPQGGARLYIMKRYMVGLDASRIINFKPIVKAGGTTFDNTTTLLTATIGYVIR
jgi:hypothetical protein